MQSALSQTKDVAKKMSLNLKQAVTGQEFRKLTSLHALFFAFVRDIVSIVLYILVAQVYFDLKLFILIHSSFSCLYSVKSIHRVYSALTLNIIKAAGKVAKPCWPNVTCNLLLSCGVPLDLLSCLSHYHQFLFCSIMKLQFT